jgi:hypothetical protein
MKIKELLNGINIPITNEEAELLDRFDESEVILKSKLEPRERLIMDSLVNKEVVRRQNKDDKVTYRKRIRN